MDILITDLTEMSPGNYCVAGWCAAQGRMIRPLPNGSNWTSSLLSQHGVVPGVTLSVIPKNVVHPGAFPHTTEDTVVDLAKIKQIQANPAQWFGANAPATAPTIEDGFGGRVQHNSVWNGIKQGVYVPIHAKVASLSAIEIQKPNLQLHEDFGKLRATIFDGSASYKIAVSSKKLKEAFRAGGIAATIKALPKGQRFHLRLGLARIFGSNPDKCYMMLNGVHG